MRHAIGTNDLGAVALVVVTLNKSVNGREAHLEDLESKNGTYVGDDKVSYNFV